MNIFYDSTFNFINVIQFDKKFKLPQTTVIEYRQLFPLSLQLQVRHLVIR